ncbi:hypothetical protein P875_00010210 [Aspergillus parasiticus SU-1]|uniref:Uncharacterized protein n=1 Tax=Aspergillus parasiticus (strain ATCC 56775 / NRRL 5862 / SRRC 143 / SU-1) TaxID=1403190 RepID=A0A0F0IFH2_ASPPU|nr:hypothetical protein P875_00010210 [Aspergillus parasiticus SU-1]
MGASDVYGLFIGIYYMSEEIHWTFLIEASYGSPLQRLRRFHACCGIESKLDEGLPPPKDSPCYKKPDRPVHERLVILPENESIEKFAIGEVGDMNRLLEILRGDLREKLSNCHHWVRDTINRLKNNDTCSEDLREKAVHISEGKWCEIDELLEQDPNMHHNVRDQDGMGLGIEHQESASQNGMSQHIAHQRGMNSDGISIDDISIDGISSHFVDQNPTTPDKISLDGLNPEFIRLLSLEENPMIRHRQNTVRHRSMNQNIPPQSSIGWNTTHRYDTNQNHMSQVAVRTKNMGQDSNNSNNKTPKGTKSSQWCCFS